MTYQLHFENHPEPVEVASGFGFKAPKSWGKMIRGNDVPTDDCCPDMEVNHLAELDQRIQKEEAKLNELMASLKSLRFRRLSGSWTYEHLSLAGSTDGPCSPVNAF